MSSTRILDIILMHLRVSDVSLDIEATIHVSRPQILLNHKITLDFTQEYWY